MSSLFHFSLNDFKLANTLKYPDNTTNAIINIIVTHISKLNFLKKLIFLKFVLILLTKFSSITSNLINIYIISLY